ncbi:MAG: hypothetical protein Q7T33_01095 [Dehalococcoidia bacterium]|nr:hypothetical protein [Dehalococcoidia bacterium]
MEQAPAGEARDYKRKLRVILAAFPDHYTLPSRPSAAPPSVADAHRQTQFLLGADLAVFEQAMNLQLGIVAANARLRTPEAAAMLALWSRVFSHLADACTLMCLGSYVSSPPLLRAACDCIAAQRSLIADGFGEYREWLADAVSQEKEQAALAFDLGRFRAGSALAEDERLGVIYRLFTDLSMPHFGSTALQTAPETSLQKLSLTFGDTAFHLGWAELNSGWLLTLAGAQLTTITASEVFAVDDAAISQAETLGRDIAATLASRRRCYVEDMAGRFLFHNFRRTGAGVPRRVLLA